MAVFSTKHQGREQTFRIQSFDDGLNTEVSPSFLPLSALTRCKNMKYAINKSLDGKPLVVLKKRQGTEKLSNSALPAAADVLACTYYVAGAKYILATASKLYYLDASFNPVEIGSISGVPTFTEFHGKLIIHDSGVTKAWNGTTFETLNCSYVDQVIGTGNNADVIFSGTLANVPVKPGSITITYTDGTVKTITDDGAGNFTGDINAGGTNTINYTSGAWAIKCSGAPDTATSLLCDYEKVAGAPKSKAGMVRANRLYMWGDSDNPSRIWYSGSNDEDGWHSSSSGGSVDVDKLDGYSIIGVMDFFQSLIIAKGNSLHRLNSYPGETDFGVVPLMQGLGGVSHRACQNIGNLLAFMSDEGWTGMAATLDYGDIKKTKDLSEKFASLAVRYANANAYTEYNQIDKQLWLTLHDGTNYLPIIHVINLETGGQLSLYEFSFGHSSYKFVNGEMLIGGTDGNLYRLFNRTSRFRDNGTSYAADTYCRGVMSNWGLSINRKHNKKIAPHVYGKFGLTATLNIYTNGDFDNAIYTTAITVPMGDSLIYDDGQDVLVYDVDDVPVGAQRMDDLHKKFNYHEVMFELTNISGALGAENYGVDFVSAVIGD